MERVFFYQRKENLKVLLFAMLLTFLGMGGSLLAASFFPKYTFSKEYLPFINHFIYCFAFLVFFPVMIAYRKNFSDFSRAISNTVLRKQYLWGCWLGKFITYLAVVGVLTLFLFINLHVWGKGVVYENEEFLFRSQSVFDYYPWIILAVLFTSFFFDNLFLFALKFGLPQVLIPSILLFAGMELFVYPVTKQLFLWIASIPLWGVVAVAVVLCFLDYLSMRILLGQDIR